MHVFFMFMFSNNLSINDTPQGVYLIKSAVIRNNSSLIKNAYPSEIKLFLT